MDLQYLRIFIEIALIIASEKRNGALQRFDIDPSSAAGAVIDQQMRSGFQNVIPNLVHSRDMLDLRDPASVFFIVYFKIFGEIYVEILSVTG